ncbi:MAG: YdcF family protein [Methylococcaceae bacterium]|nr:YdcF family protein [Methylococcaceae bacterium]
MNTENLVSFLLQQAAFPPGLQILLLIPALISRRPKIRMLSIVFGLGSLYWVSIPATSHWLRSKLEIYPQVSLEAISAKAIVVLGADRRHNAAEYGGGDTMSHFGLERLRYAAWLHRKTGLPVLASGGSASGEPVPEAELMREILKEFGVEARWMEVESRNTYENALYSTRLLKSIGIEEILLVTHAWHMPRAVEAFDQAGIRVTPAPTGLMNPSHKMDLKDWIPNASAFYMTQIAMHELLGRCWYRYRYYGR